ASGGRGAGRARGARRRGGRAGAGGSGAGGGARHYHVTLMSDSFLRGILAELELDAEIEWVETRTGVFAGGRLFSVSNTLELLRFPVLGWLDTLRLGATVLYASRLRDWPRLEQIPVVDWLARGVGRRAPARFWLAPPSAPLGETYRDTSAAFIWATIQRLYAARRSGMKKEMFGYVPGGYARVLERFHERLEREGVEVRLGCRVARVEPSGRMVKVELAGGGV